MIRSAFSRRFAASLVIAGLSLPMADVPAIAAQAKLFPKSPSAAKPSSRPLSAKEIYERGLSATGWIISKVDGPNVDFGTGWIVDRDQRLMVTNQHVIERGSEFIVFFPTRKDGKLQKDPAYYERHQTPIKARLIDTDFDRDLALLQLEELPEEVEALPLAAKGVEEGDEIRTVAGLSRGNGGLWGSARGEVRLVTRQPLVQRTRPVMVVVSDCQTNQGNSGGALLNDRGEVVAVVQGHAAGDVRGVSFYIDLSEIKAYLAEALPLVEPSTARQFLTRGQRHQRAGRRTAAIADFTNAVRIDAKLVAAYIERGWCFHQHNDTTTAIEDFSEALSLDPNHPDALRCRGIAYRSQERYDEALADLTKAIRNDPNGASNYYQRALTLKELERFEEALADLDRCLQLDSASAEYYAARGSVRIDLEQYKEALNDLDQADRRSPNNAEYLNDAGVCLYRLKQYQPASQLFAKAAQLNPNNATYYTNCADALRQLGNLDLAVNILTEALGNKDFTTADVAHLLFHRGLALLAKKDPNHAIGDFNRAIEMASEIAEYYHERANAWKAVNRTEEELNDRRKAAQLDPDTYGDYVKQASRVEHKTEKRQIQTHPMVATWRYRQTINGTAIDMTLVTHANGTYAAKITLQEQNGQQSNESYSGRWETQNGYLVLHTTDGRVLRHRYTLNGNRLELVFAHMNNLALTFHRSN